MMVQGIKKTLTAAVVAMMTILSVSAVAEVIFFEDFTVLDEWRARPEFDRIDDINDGTGFITQDTSGTGVLSFPTDYDIRMGGYVYYRLKAPVGMTFENIVLSQYCMAETNIGGAWYGYVSCYLSGDDWATYIGGNIPQTQSGEWVTLEYSTTDYDGVTELVFHIQGQSYHPNSGPYYANIDWVKVEADLAPGGEWNCSDAIEADYKLAGDVDEDCDVDLTDAATLISDWTECFDPCNENCGRPWVTAYTFDGPMTIHHVGEYGGVPWTKPGNDPADSHQTRCWGMNLSVASLGVWDAGDPNWEGTSKLDSAARNAYWGAQQGYAYLPRLYFWNGDERFEGTPEDVSVYQARIDLFLDGMIERDVLQCFAGIVLAEENVTSRAGILTDLYNHIKANYDVEVYQWWSPYSTVPNYLVPADGWVIDPYELGGVDFRRYAQRYMVTGKPVVVMPWAGWGPSMPEWTTTQWDTYNSQLDVCREYNLPASFFWVLYNADGSSSSTGFSLGQDNFMDAINDWVIAYKDEAQALPADYAGLASADSAVGDGVPMAPLGGVEMYFDDHFVTSEFIVKADIEGFRHLLWEEGRTLALRSWNGEAPSASLVYRFTDAGNTTSYPQCSVDVSDVAAGSSVTLSVSPDGVSWSHATTATTAGTLSIDTAGDANFAGIGAFQVRVDVSGTLTTGDVAVRIDNVDVTADIL